MAAVPDVPDTSVQQTLTAAVHIAPPAAAADDAGTLASAPAWAVAAAELGPATVGSRMSAAAAARIVAVVAFALAPAVVAMSR